MIKISLILYRLSVNLLLCLLCSTKTVKKAIDDKYKNKVGIDRNEKQY